MDVFNPVSTGIILVLVARRSACPRGWRQFVALDAVHDTLLQNMTYEALLADWQKIVCVLGTSVTLLVSVSNAMKKPPGGGFRSCG